MNIITRLSEEEHQLDSREQSNSDREKRARAAYATACTGNSASLWLLPSTAAAYAVAHATFQQQVAEINHERQVIAERRHAINSEREAL